jgi:hypothetical protein
VKGTVSGIASVLLVIAMLVLTVDIQTVRAGIITQVADDLAIVGVAPSKTIVGQGFGFQVNVTVSNRGDHPEALNIVLYANATTIATFAGETLLNGKSETIDFSLNTAGFAKGNYTLSAYAKPVPGEIDTTNNYFTGGWVVVATPGDLTGGPSNIKAFVPDGKVDLMDATVLAWAWNSAPGDPRWNPNCDINNDGRVDSKDLAILGRKFVEAGSPDGNLVAKLYAHSGTFGSDSVPTGTALATSNAVPMANVPTSLALVTFTFPSPYPLNAANYCISVEVQSGTVNASNSVAVSRDSTTPSHAGNRYLWRSGAYLAVSGEDLNFYVYGTTGTSPTERTIDSHDGSKDLLGTLAAVHPSSTTDPSAAGQSFTGVAGSSLTRCAFYMQKTQDRARAQNVNLAVIPDDWSLTFGEDPQIIFLDYSVVRTQGEPSVRIEPHTTLDVNDARECDGTWYRVRPGDHIVAKCWIKVDDTTQDATPLDGGRIGMDLYGPSGAGDITILDGFPHDGAEHIASVVNWGTTDWTLRTWDIVIPNTIYTQDTEGNVIPPTPITCMVLWLDVRPVNLGICWFADAELHINPSS